VCGIGRKRRVVGGEMDVRIDLTGGKKRLTLAELKFAKLLRLGMGVLLAVYIGLMVGIAAYRLVLTRNEQVVIDQIARREREIQDKLPLETRLVFADKKLDLIDDLFREKATEKVLLDFFYGLAPTGVSLTDVSFAEKGDEKFVLAGEAESVFSFGTFINTLEEAIGQGLFVEVELSSMKREANGRYRFSLSVLIDIAEFEEG